MTVYLLVADGVRYTCFIWRLVADKKPIKRRCYAQFAYRAELLQHSFIHSLTQWHCNCRHVLHFSQYKDLSCDDDDEWTALASSASQDSSDGHSSDYFQVYMIPHTNFSSMGVKNSKTLIATACITQHPHISRPTRPSIPQGAVSVITWITRVATIKRQTRAANGSV